MVLVDLDSAVPANHDDGVGVDDDHLLDELLNGSYDDEESVDPSTISSQESFDKVEKYRQKRTPSDNTSTTHSDEDYSGSNDNSQERIVVYDLAAYEDDETSELSSTQSFDESNESENLEESVTDLLERAHDRIAMQNLHEEIKKLHEAIRRKDEEVEHLSGQLRRAVSTKCDLVIAHTEMERHHENRLAQEEQVMQSLKKEKVQLEESKCQTERELLDELVKLTDELKEARLGHRQELEDWERLHRNEMLEKDLQIAQLTEEVRKLQGFEHNRKKKGTGMKVVFRKN